MSGIEEGNSGMVEMMAHIMEGSEPAPATIATALERIATALERHNAIQEEMLEAFRLLSKV